MKRLLPIVMSLLLVAMLPMQAHARNTVPVETIEKEAIKPASGKTLSLAQVKQAVTTAAEKNDWKVTSATEGKIQATLEVRQKHTVRIEITYDATAYSILYKDSVNMKYETKYDQAYIHPFYNKWVGILKNSIDQELSKL
ncbi:hypothetical protein [Methylophilus sp.]|uniref:hypothetical protein n=1 Tax=Methylophilus sp. TaxID=29541 RepID=UPI0040361A5A